MKKMTTDTRRHGGELQRTISTDGRREVFVENEEERSSNDDDDDDDDDETVTVTRTQTRCRSTLERAMMSSEYLRARSCDRMRFQDLRARLFGLARTFDTDNRRTVCDLVRSLTIDYFTSLYEMSYRSYRFFDAASRQACSLLPVALAITAATNDNAASGGKINTTTEWLTRRAIEDFCRVQFYRAYEYSRCYELQRIIVLEAFDRDDYADYVIDLFLRENETLARQREAAVARWTNGGAAATSRPEKNSCRYYCSLIATVTKVARCLRVLECPMRDTRRETPTITSLDLALAAAIQRARAASNDGASSSGRRNSFEDAATMSAANWPSWNLPLSKYATSLAKARTVGSVDERIDVAARAENGEDNAAAAAAAAAWSCLSSESYDYMLLYRYNAKCDRRSIRGDSDFYTSLFCTLFDVIEKTNTHE